MRVFGLQFDKQNIRNSNEIQAKVNAYYDYTVGRLVRLASKQGVKVTQDQPLDLDEYPQFKKTLQREVSVLQKRLVDLLLKGTETQWELANLKNDELVKSFTRNLNIPKEILNKWNFRNLKALESFQSRKIDGRDLSKRIWESTETLKGNIGMALDIALGEGKSANELSRDIRKYLVEPDKLFRRVRDKHGGLYLSQEAKKYSPGTGVYRSSYKNAMRLARTEINSAYRTADNERIKNLDFVVGIEIRRSNRVYECDVCSTLVGKYPKDFLFTGWHPQCRCFALSILSTETEFVDQMKLLLSGSDKKIHSINNIAEPPQAFKKWLQENNESIERSQKRGTAPYWIKDNTEAIHLMEARKLDMLTNEDISKYATENKITEDIFAPNGKYTEERKVIHEDIIAEYMNIKRVESDKVYMLGGAPANGKSTVADSGLLPHPDGILTIDADKVKAMIPEYKNMLESGDKELVRLAANFVHEESSMLGKEIQKRAFEQNLGVLIDGVNDGNFRKINDRANAIRNVTGKTIRADYVSLDASLSEKLAMARAKKTGREVPIKFVRSMNREISRVFPKLLKENTFDELYLWDTNIQAEGRLILSKVNGKLTIFNQELYDDFLNKGK